LAEVMELAGPVDARNSSAEREKIRPKRIEWRHGMKDGSMRYEFPERSFTVIRME